jgi:hypothetical protein
VSIRPFRRNDLNIDYAFRITTTDCEAITEALRNKDMHIRLRVYAEHPWSARGKTFEVKFTHLSDTKFGDFVLGYDLTIEDEDDVRAEVEAVRNKIQ